MTNQSLVSVIIPVYNSAAFLERCLNSVVNQTYQNLEIIMINDGSTDHSLDICNAYAGRDSRIKIIDQQNGGVSRARNAGLAIASGEYITFVDSDDWIEPEMYSVLVSLITEHDADVSCCKAEKVFPEGSEEGKRYHKVSIKDTGNIFLYENGDCLRSLFEFKDGNVISQSVWNKIFKRELLQGMSFLNDLWDEDAILLTEVFDKAHKVVMIDRIYYHWYQHGASITHANEYVTEAESHIMKYSLQLSLQKKHNLVKAYNNTLLNYLCLLNYMYCELRRYHKKDERWKAAKRNTIREQKKLRREVKEIIMRNGMPRRRKCMLLLSLISLRLYSVVNRKCFYW